MCIYTRLCLNKYNMMEIKCIDAVDDWGQVGLPIPGPGIPDNFRVNLNPGN